MILEQQVVVLTFGLDNDVPEDGRLAVGDVQELLVVLVLSPIQCFCVHRIYGRRYLFLFEAHEVSTEVLLN